MGARLALAFCFTGLGYIAVMQSLAMVVQKRAPGEAYKLAPHNGFIIGQLAGKMSGPTASALDRGRADRLARLALRRDPTAIDAAVALGLNMQIRGNTEFARRLFAYAQALSRRNLQAQLWAIDDAVTQGDLPVILKHFDIALRTSQIASPLLFPTLTTAIVEPEIRAALAQTLAKAPPWASGFMGYIAGNGADPETTASLFQAVSHLGGIIPDHDSSSVIKALIASEKFSRAWAYYASLHPGADRHLSRDPFFENHTQAPSPFDWIPTNDGNISASIQPGGRNGSVLTFTAPPSIGGHVVRQIEMLPPGNYVLQGQSEGIDQTDDARPYWSLNCNDGREIGRVDVPNSSVENGLFRGRLTVPADCPTQVLTLDLRPSSNVSGITGQIDRALLRPAK